MQKSGLKVIHASRMHKAGEWRDWRLGPKGNCGHEPITLLGWLPREPEEIACLQDSGQTAERKCIAPTALVRGV